MLADDLKTLLATSYAFVIKAQNFHWNVEGSDFSQYHQFFQGIYDEVYGNAIDQTAEYIRTLDVYAPGSFERFSQLSVITGQIKIPRAMLMIKELQEDNEAIQLILKQTFESATAEKNEGIANFIAERMDAHAKHGWMLRSFLKESRE
ncbi:DNA starvation/stationary phase protection protein [bacterium]|nr:DNA starvation/stationary phase protection protein [bacterium]